MITTMFKDEMLKAVLDLRKTQTRRLDGLKEINKNPHKYESANNIHGTNTWAFKIKNHWRNKIYPVKFEYIKCKYKIGDIVGIKENFEILEYQINKVIIKYLFDNETDCKKLTVEEFRKFSKWKNQICSKSKLFMFDSLIRYKIQITDIRVERVQDISLEDIKKEGVLFNTNDIDIEDYRIDESALKEDWKNLWDSINKKRGYGWDKNLWNWVISFKKVEI